MYMSLHDMLSLLQDAAAVPASPASEGRGSQKPEARQDAQVSPSVSGAYTLIKVQSDVVVWIASNTWLRSWFTIPG